MTEAELIAALRDRMAGLGTVKRLKDFELDTTVLQPGEMMAITDRALALLSQFYVHLPIKRVLHATDPEQALRNLREDLAAVDRGFPSVDDREFHARMSAIFTALRDRHTTYLQPGPYRRTIAFLPFHVEAVTDGREREYLVTKVFGSFGNGFEAPHGAGADAVRLTHWNGVPIERAVALNGDRNNGANAAARIGRGIDRLTFRWLGSTPPPDEEWVVVTYEAGGRRRQQRFEWLAVQRPEEAPGAGSGSRASSFAVAQDLEGEWIREVKQALFARPEKWERQAFDGKIAYRRHPRAGGRAAYGYLRIYSFDVEDDRADAFVAAVRSILRRAPRRGLIIDLRGNPGGLIGAAEGLMALFSPRRVEVEGLQFRNTSQAAMLAENLFAGGADRALFQAVLNDAWTTASPYIVSLPVSPPESPPVPDQIYQGPVVLIVDALCYSAAEILAAGMQDNELAAIVGTAKQTGGGGANVWSQELICQAFAGPDGKLPGSFGPPESDLPGGVSFQIALRRTTRVRSRAGVGLEDLGVVVNPTDLHELERADVLGDNEALLDFAIEKLDPALHRIGIKFDGQRTFKLTTTGVDRVDVYVDGRPVASETEPNGKAIAVGDGAAPKEALFLGYESDLAAGTGGSEPVTSVRWRV